MIKENAWNQVMWRAINNIKETSEIDDFFSNCEKKLYALKAPRKETELRLLALAHYCNNIYKRKFIKSSVFSRFEPALGFFHFERVAKALISKNSRILVVFWVVLRLSYKDCVPESQYSQIETEMKDKVLRIGTNFVY